MTLIKTSLLNLIAVGARLASMLVLNKILAIEVGPNGFGLVGQLQNAITSIVAIGSAGVGSGVTKYTAEHNNSLPNQRQIWVAASALGLFFSLFASAGIIVYRNELSLKLFKTSEYQDVLVWVAACLVLYVLNSLLMSIINGLKEIETYVLANIANSFLALIITGFLATFYELRGALIALAINQSFACAATLLIVRKKYWFKLYNFIGIPSIEVISLLFRYSLMAIATSVLGPLSIILVRDMLISDSGLSAAGYWEALTRISNLSIMLITTPLSVYYLPKLSELAHKEDLLHEIRQGIYLIVPLSLFISMAIYFARDLLITILFTDDFVVMSDLFFWQLVGDVIRVAAWLFSYFLISKALTRQFIIVEVVCTVSFVLLSGLLIQTQGVAGVTIAYAVNNAIYLLILVSLVHRILRATPSRPVF
jgi:PST family polysaccharide transporter